MGVGVGVRKEKKEENFSNAQCGGVLCLMHWRIGAYRSGSVPVRVSVSRWKAAQFAAFSLDRRVTTNSPELCVGAVPTARRLPAIFFHSSDNRRRAILTLVVFIFFFFCFCCSTPDNSVLPLEPSPSVIPSGNVALEDSSIDDGTESCCSTK